MFWQAVRVLCLTAWLIVIARHLGPESYGLFAGVAGLATALGGLSGLGLGLLMMQETSRRPAEFGRHWRKALRALLLSGLLFSATFVLIAPEDARSSLSAGAILAIGLSELLFFPMVTQSAFAFAAHERMSWATAIPAMMAGARFLAALALSQLPNQPLETYAWLHALASMGAGLFALWITHRILKPEKRNAGVVLRDLREGVGFSAVWAVGNAYSSLDKTVVLQLTDSHTAGLYASAYRVASTLAQPVEALTAAAMARLFRRGGGDGSHPNLLRKLVGASLGYAALAAILLWALADLLPMVLGPEFAPAVEATRMMALFIPIYGMRTLACNTLLADGKKHLRLAVDLIGLAMLLLLAHWWLPRYGLLGAVRMIIVAEAVIAVLAWMVIWHGHTRQVRGSRTMPATSKDDA